MRLWRAADDDYVEQGTSFAETKRTARVYLDNPGFGGAQIYFTRVDPNAERVVDLTSMSTRALARYLDLPDPGAIGIDEWIPRSPKVLDALRKKDFLWARVAESHPHGTVTWLWLGHALDDEPTLEAVR